MTSLRAALPPYAATRVSLHWTERLLGGLCVLEVGGEYRIYNRQPKARWLTRLHVWLAERVLVIDWEGGPFLDDEDQAYVVAQPKACCIAPLIAIATIPTSALVAAHVFV